MTDEQRNRLKALLPGMRTMAYRKVKQNDFSRAIMQANELQCYLHGEPQDRTAEEWLSIAEKAAEGHDKPGIVRMPSMAAVLSGMPPEHKGD